MVVTQSVVLWSSDQQFFAMFHFLRVNRPQLLLFPEANQRQIEDLAHI